MTNTSAKIFSIQAIREIKAAEQEDPNYTLRVGNMDKVELLEEMVRYQEERSKLGELTVSLMVRGRVLFKALEEHAETVALRSLTSAYRRHLELELADYLGKSRAKTSGEEAERIDPRNE